MTKILKCTVPYNIVNGSMYITGIADFEMRDGDIIDGAIITSDEIMNSMIINKGQYFCAIKLEYIVLLESNREIIDNRITKICDGKIKRYRVL